MTTKLDSTGTGRTDQDLLSAPLRRGVDIPHRPPRSGVDRTAGYGFATGICATSSAKPHPEPHRRH
jgi:hypothetical protein